MESDGADDLVVARCYIPLSLTVVECGSNFFHYQITETGEGRKG